MYSVTSDHELPSRRHSAASRQQTNMREIVRYYQSIVTCIYPYCSLAIDIAHQGKNTDVTQNHFTLESIDPISWIFEINLEN